jgi:methylthioribose-1-phosphate isomerase
VPVEARIGEPRNLATDGQDEAMKIQGRDYHSLWELPEQDGIEVIDQRVLPHRFATAVLRTPENVAVAIREMYVRGAPLIGATAAYGIYLATRGGPDEHLDTRVAEAAERLLAARPTAVNLRWAVEYTLDRMRRGQAPEEKRRLALEAARRIVADEHHRSRQIGETGVGLLHDIVARKRGAAAQILTHCNAGWLATIDYGTATAPIYVAQEQGIPLHVWVDETRPRNQGAALTAFEFCEQGIPHAVIADNAGGHLMQQGLVDVVIVGADRVAANGDTANKIGTYLKALAAHANGVPFYVALPSSTFDGSVAAGSDIPIEERAEDEVRFIEGLGPHGPTRVRLVPERSPARNFAFDVTPASLITGFITERGILSPEALREELAAP